MKKIALVLMAVLCLSSFAFAADKVVIVEAEKVQTIDANIIAQSVNWEKVKADAVNETISFLKAGKDFVVEQTPSICKEVIAWGIAKGILFIIIGTVFLIICWRVVKWARKNWDDLEDGVVAAVSVLGAIILIITGLILFLIGLFDLAYIVAAPRLYLIEYFTHLLK